MIYRDTQPTNDPDSSFEGASTPRDSERSLSPDAHTNTAGPSTRGNSFAMHRTAPSFGVPAFNRVDACELPPTQPTPAQHATRARADAHTGTLWGFLEPLNRDLPRLEFARETREYRVGRDRRQCQVVLADPRISGLHCTLRWNGKEDSSSSVTIVDSSSNGTWVDGKRLDRKSYITLREGNEVAFATPDEPTCADLAHEDNRYVFYHTANIMPIHSSQASRP